MDMIDGQYADLDGQRIETMDDLFTYCRQVASSVGLACIHIWGYSNPAAPALAVDRGIAFQLTNILRDVQEDVERGRCYLPAIQMEEASITPDDLIAWRPSDRCESIITGWVNIAREHYERSAPLDDMIDATCRPTLWAMTTIYRELLERIGRDPQRVVREKRVSLSALHKTSIAVRARWMARGGRNAG
jgi:phytoene synthase